MTSVHINLETINEIEKVELQVDSDHEIEEMNEKLNYVCEMAAQEFYKLKTFSSKVTNILENNYNLQFMNKNFDEQELIEEQLDKLMFEYVKVKELLKKGREIRFYKEAKEKKIAREKMIARNILAHCGIKPVD